eukprot:3335785-Alexandrium_andersonii.AAC.1
MQWSQGAGEAALRGQRRPCAAGCRQCAGRWGSRGPSRQCLVAHQAGCQASRRCCWHRGCARCRPGH